MLTPNRGPWMMIFPRQGSRSETGLPHVSCDPLLCRSEDRAFPPCTALHLHMRVLCSASGQVEDSGREGVEMLPAEQPRLV